MTRLYSALLIQRPVKKKKGASIYIYAKKAARCFGTSIEWDMALGLSQHEALLLYIYIYRQI